MYNYYFHVKAFQYYTTLMYHTLLFLSLTLLAFLLLGRCVAHAKLMAAFKFTEV
jgi:hypothetical protein